MPAGNHGSCIHQNNYPVQDDEYNYHDSPQAQRIDGIGHLQSGRGRILLDVKPPIVKCSVWKWCGVFVLLTGPYICSRARFNSCILVAQQCSGVRACLQQKEFKLLERL